MIKNLIFKTYFMNVLRSGMKSTTNVARNTDGHGFDGYSRISLIRGNPCYPWNLCSITTFSLISINHGSWLTLRPLRCLILFTAESAKAGEDHVKPG